MCPPQSRRPSARAFFTNLAGPQPWTEKVSLLLKNNWLKIRHFQDCCGHPGQPGC